MRNPVAAIYDAPSLSGTNDLELEWVPYLPWKKRDKKKPVRTLLKETFQSRYEGRAVYTNVPDSLTILGLRSRFGDKPVKL